VLGKKENRRDPAGSRYDNCRATNDNSRGSEGILINGTRDRKRHFLLLPTPCALLSQRCFFFLPLFWCAAAVRLAETRNIIPPAFSILPNSGYSPETSTRVGHSRERLSFRFFHSYLSFVRLLYLSCRARRVFSSVSCFRIPYDVQLRIPLRIEQSRERTLAIFRWTAQARLTACRLARSPSILAKRKNSRYVERRWTLAGNENEAALSALIVNYRAQAGKENAKRAD